MKRHTLLTCICLTAALLLSGCGSTAKADTAQNATNSIADSTEVQGLWAQDIQTTSLSGESVTADTFSENTLTILNVWATWCPPCVEELPHLQAASEAFSDRGVQIIGVLQDGVTELLVPDETAIASAQTLLTDAGASYLVILPDETITASLIRQMQYFPTTYFIDQNGTIINTVVGANDAEAWEAMIHEALEALA